MTTPALTAPTRRTRRCAAVAGVVFAVLLLVAMTLMRLALSDADPGTMGILGLVWRRKRPSRQTFDLRKRLPPLPLVSVFLELVQTRGLLAAFGPHSPVPS